MTESTSQAKTIQLVVDHQSAVQIYEFLTIGIVYPTHSAVCENLAVLWVGLQTNINLAANAAIPQE
jgi:hypothetical protein